METLYKWRVQENDRRGNARWRLMKCPMTEETARFWAANNNRVIQRIDLTVAAGTSVSPGMASPLVTEAFPKRAQGQ